MTEGVRREAYKLPEIRLPSLENLKVQVVSPPAPSADELIEALHQKLRACASRRERKPGEALSPGDEVECDIVTVVDGQVIPGSVRHGVRLEMRTFEHMPGFIENLLEMKTFSARTFSLSLPADYPVLEMAGKTATFYVEVRRAFQVDQPELDDEARLREAGLGGDLDEAMETIAAQLDEEQGQQLLIDASQAVLEAVAERVSEEVPKAAVDEELRRLWQTAQAPVLQGREFPEEMVKQALVSFLEDPLLRAEATDRIKIGLVLGALIKEKELAPSAEVVQDLLQEAAEAVGISTEEAREAVGGDPLEAQKVGFAGLYHTAVEYLVGLAEVEILEAP
ncbi:MAG: hypothetical protein WC314_22945 [Vulcanimicrobiota bacterium]